MTTPEKRYAVPDILPNAPTKDALAERRLNEAFAICFRGASGDAAIAELRRIARDRVLRPPHVEGVLSYVEGARALLDVIEQRIQLGRERKPDVQE